MLERHLQTKKSSLSSRVNRPSYKRLVWLLSVVSFALLLLFAETQSRLSRIKGEIEFARDEIRMIQNRRAAALAGDASQATLHLEALQLRPELEPLKNIMADFVERERIAAVRDIITYLRNKTGRDYGDAPEKWIEALKVAEQPTYDAPR